MSDQKTLFDADELRTSDNSKILITAIKKHSDPNTLDDEIIDRLLDHNVRDVRVEMVKLLGKGGSNDSITQKLLTHFEKESDSIVKRECVSSLGRKRDVANLEFFQKVTEEKDPKIVLQAIRALLVFKKNDSVISVLQGLLDHPNEMIKEVLEIELGLKPKTQRKNHSQVDERLKDSVVNGDVINVLREIKEESFHLTFTSPPYYNARDYSFYSSYQDYLDFLQKVFRETHRLTKNGRFLIVNTSPVIVPRVSRKHSSKRYPIPFDIHSFLVKDGWEFIDDIIWRKPETSVKNRVGGFIQHRKPLGYKPNTITEYLMVYRKKSTDLLDWNMKQYDPEIIEESKVEGDFESTNVWDIDPTFDKTHSAVFPKQLCERVIRYYSMKGDLVFDPFGGSGTLAEVAFTEGRHFFLTEIMQEYVERIKDKLSRVGASNTRYQSQKEFTEWMRQEK